MADWQQHSASSWSQWPDDDGYSSRQGACSRGKGNEYWRDQIRKPLIIKLKAKTQELSESQAHVNQLDGVISELRSRGQQLEEENTQLRDRGNEAAALQATIVRTEQARKNLEQEVNVLRQSKEDARKASVSEAGRLQTNALLAKTAMDAALEKQIRLDMDNQALRKELWDVKSAKTLQKREMDQRAQEMEVEIHKRVVLTAEMNKHIVHLEALQKKQEVTMERQAMALADVTASLAREQEKTKLLQHMISEADVSLASKLSSAVAAKPLDSASRASPSQAADISPTSPADEETRRSRSSSSRSRSSSSRCSSDDADVKENKKPRRT